jgi:hypothetical protein
MNPQQAKLLSYAITGAVILLVVFLRLRRMNQIRPLKLEMLWIVPATYLTLFALLVIYAPGRPTGTDWLWLAAAAAAGGVVGWYRGKMMQIIVDPQTHALNQKASPAAMILLLAILGVRFGLRFEADSWGLNIALVTDASVAFVVAMFSVLRVEMFLRARRMLTEARALGAPTSPPLDQPR